VPTVARACNVSTRTVESWLKTARDGNGNELQNAFLRAIQSGISAAEKKAIKKILDAEDPRNAQWFLTHHPMLRDTWSDAAAERRAATTVLTAVVKALDTAGLPPDQRQSVLLNIQAQGLALPASDAAD
jgi:DNA-directed RNA polymerase specialized sigma24 family protein